MRRIVPSGLTFLMVLSTAHAELNAAFKAGNASDARIDRLPALVVKAGESATPFLAPGAFEVTWSGKLVLPARQRPTFTFEGNGSATLTIDGKLVLEESGALGTKSSERARLNPGEHEIAITFKSQPDGSGRFRLLWEEASFFRHEIPFSAFTASPLEEVTAGELQRRGRLLFTQHHCMKCHAAKNGMGTAPMPELGEFAPLLAGAGERMNEAWLKNWIAAPHTLRPDSHMPALLDPATDTGRQQAADIAAFIASQKLGLPLAPTVNTVFEKSPVPERAKKGGETFHALGCVACHTLPDSESTDAQRVPLNNVAAKFHPTALVGFLKKPDAMHPTSPMPNFRLSDEEALMLATYLISASTGKETKLPQAMPAGDAARGVEAVKSLQCGSCHPGLPMAEKTSAPALEAVFAKDWNAGGCVAAADKRGKAPKLNLNDDDRTALVAFAKAGSAPLMRDHPAEYTRRQITASRCVACHANDGQQALLDKVHAESRNLVADLKHLDERVAQDRPQLTYVGEMLHTPYIASMIDGTTTPRPRPWLLMRMPGFPSRAAALAEGFTRMHGLESSLPAPVVADAEKAAIGKTLLEASGFGCNTCHAIGDTKPTAAFEVEGVNLKLAPIRLREEYYYHWMDHPAAVTPGTKMPRYSESNESQRKDVLEGDARKQFEAIWQYLHQK